MKFLLHILTAPHGSLAGVPLSLLNLLIVVVALGASYYLARRAKTLAAHPRLTGHVSQSHRNLLEHALFTVVMLFGTMLTMQIVGFELTQPIWAGTRLTPFRLASVAGGLVLVVFGSRILGRLVSYRLHLGGILNRQEQEGVGQLLHLILLLFGLIACLHSLNLPVMVPFATLGSSSISFFSLSVFLSCAMAVWVGSQIGSRLVQFQLLVHTPLDAGARYAIGRITYYSLIIVGLLTAFQTIGVQLGSVTVLVGALGVGVGLGMQNMVSNFVSGLVVLLERPIQTGDFVEVGKGKGRVGLIGFRSTTIVTSDNTAVIVPNADLTTAQIINWSHRDPTVRAHISVLVSGDCDLEQVGDLMLGAAAAHPSVLKEPPPAFSLVDFTESGLKVELAYSIDLGKSSQATVRGDLNMAIWRALRDDDIKLPFPRNEFYLVGGPNEDGRAVLAADGA